MTLTLREMVDMALASESKRLLQIMDPFLASTATEEGGKYWKRPLNWPCLAPAQSLRIDPT